LDGIVIVEEAIHSTQKVKKGGNMIKLGISKVVVRLIGDLSFRS
jgi:hypothetical protein